MRISDWSSDVCSSDLLGLPRATVTGGDRPLPSLPPSTAGLAARQTPFPEPAVETAYPTGLAARHAIVDQLRRPLRSLPAADRAITVPLLGATLDKALIPAHNPATLQYKRGTRRSR